MVDSLGCLSGERMKRNAKHSFFKGRVPGCVQKNAKHFYSRLKPWKWRVSRVFSCPFRCRGVSAGVFLKWPFLKKRTACVLFLDFFVNKEYKVFFFPPILIFENSPSILKSEQMSKKEYFIFFLKEYLKKENT